MRLTACVLGAVAALIGPASADPIFRITEAYVGATGEDGTPDWIEVTNFGTMAGDTGILWYDDESLSVAAGVQLPSFSIAPGESAVFLVTGDVEPTSIDDFTALWGPVANLGAAAGGGGMSQNGDTAGLLLADDTVVDTLVFPGLPQDNVATIYDPTGLATPQELLLSAVGVGGAYESVPFFNDNIGGAANEISLVGSPGVNVPEPAAGLLVVLSLAGVAARRRS